MGKMAVPAAPVAAQANELLFNLALQRLERSRPTVPDLRLWVPLPEVIRDLQENDLPAVEVLGLACAAYAGRPALGERDQALDTGPAGRILRPLPAFRNVSYGELWQRVTHLAGGLARDGRTALRPGEVVGVYGFGSIDFAVADLACLYAGLVSAVLQTTMGGEELRHLVNEASYACIICGLEYWPVVREVLPACPTVRCVALMDVRAEADAEAAALAQAQSPRPLLTLAELAAEGAAGSPMAPVLPARDEDPLATLMYTSGSTGFPKGAMLTQSLWRSHLNLYSLHQLAQFPQIGVSFHPLNHVLGRHSLLRTMMLGGISRFTLKSDLSTLFEDLRLARPTFLYLVPRVAEMIYQAFRADLQRRRDAGAATAEARDQAYDAMRTTLLGERLTAALIGSAPTAPEILEFLTSCFAVPVFEGYGSTEAGVVTLDGCICRPPVTDYKLADAPELGYRLDDQPYPRGELLVKTLQCVPGYHRNPAASEALYDADGFMRTGDIVEQRAPDQVTWVDRRNNVVKLAQGEYVTLWRLESTFSAGSPCLDQIRLYANSARSHLLAVVVPLWPAVRERLGVPDAVDPDPAALKQLLRAELNRVASAARLRAFEVPRDFLVEPERWTRENGLLTGLGKPARPRLKRRYGERLEALYAQLEAQREQQLAAVARPGGPATVAEQVRQAVAAVLGLPEPDLAVESLAAGSFRDLGGDSLGALTLAHLLEDLCRVPVPVAAVLNPAGTLAALARDIEARQGRSAEVLPGFREVHGAAPRRIHRDQLELEAFLRPADLDRASVAAARSLPDQVRTVLLTGANGFLGHILALEWLERMAGAGRKIICLVRAADDDAAAARMAAAFGGPDPELGRRFQARAGEGLEVLAGDLAQPGLGLAPERWERLAREVDLIVHPGALVNHMFSYEQLFPPNVAGTAQLVRLALDGRRKRIDFVSTVGVLAGALGPGPVPERAGVDALSPDWPVSGGYAHGYATSKWAGEVLLHEAHRRFGLPARVFRCGMILPHRSHRCQVNLPDLLTRLLASVVRTGLAPRSFYRDADAARAHFDGLPVDFIAAAAAALSSADQDDYATYQVSNAHWTDGVSLDTFMDWVASAGHPLRRIADHGEWLRAFESGLRALPPEQRQHSSLPILQQWAQPLTAWERERIDTAQFTREVRSRRPRGEADVPHLDEAFLHRYLADLGTLGII